MNPRPIFAAGILLAMLVPNMAFAQRGGVSLQSLLDKGFRVVAGTGTLNGDALVLQKDNQVFACFDNGGAATATYHYTCTALH